MNIEEQNQIKIIISDGCGYNLTPNKVFIKTIRILTLSIEI